MVELINKLDELLILMRCLMSKHDIITKFDIAVADKDIVADCNSISFENVGDVDAFIDGKYPLKAGDPSFIIPTQIPHRDITTYKLTFDQLSTNTNQRVVIIRKIIIGQ